MRLYLWRHGKAEPASETGRDRDRKLLPQGEADVRKAAKALADRGHRPERIFTSPYVRARETARAIQEVLLCPEGVYPLAELSAGASPETVLAALRSLPSLPDSIILVGHMPDLGELADRLDSDLSQHGTHFAAGEVVGIELDGWGATGRGKRICRIAPASA